MTVMPADYRSSLPQTATLSTFSDGSDRWPEDSSCWRCMVPMGLGGVDGRQKSPGARGRGSHILSWKKLTCDSTCPSKPCEPLGR